MTDLTCPDCGKAGKLVTGREIYPHRPDLYSKQFWACPTCDCYVGCHPNSTTPLGRLSNAETRRLKSAAHALLTLTHQEVPDADTFFPPLWDPPAA